MAHRKVQLTIENNLYDNLLIGDIYSDYVSTRVVVYKSLPTYM